MHEISLNIDNIDILTEFLNNVINTEVTGSDAKGSLKEWRNFGFSHQDELNLARKSLINIISQYTCGEIDEKTLKSFFSYLHPDLQERAMGIIMGRREEFLRHLAFKRISTHQKAMKSFDWDVKWILGSSSSSTVQKHITSLTLSCRRGRETPEDLHVEMDREHLDKLIVALERHEQ